MAEEIIRPSGFPISEEEFHEMKKIRMQDILSGNHVDTYSEWCLRGAPGESPHGIVMALGIFPTPGTAEPKYILEPEDVSLNSQRSLIEYWRDVTTLQIPKRVVALEKLHYRQLITHGDQILEQYLFNLMGNLMPSVMIAFFRPKAAAIEESAYLICPTLIPPSAAFRHIFKQAQLQIL